MVVTPEQFMKALIRFIASFGMLTFLSVPSSADTIVLKDGRRIEAEKVWLEGEVVRYKKFGTVVGLPTRQVARVITEGSTNAGPVVDFGFDFWKLGMDINEVMDIAERNQEGVKSALDS